MPRRHLQKEDLAPHKFDGIVRYMIVAAEKKRFVEYNELNKIFGISLEDLRNYAGNLGDYCEENNYPFLNALIVSTDGTPGEDFFTWAKCEIDDWGVHVAGCLKKFHIPSDNKKRFQNTSRISDSISSFLKD